MVSISSALSRHRFPPSRLLVFWLISFLTSYSNGPFDMRQAALLHDLPNHFTAGGDVVDGPREIALRDGLRRLLVERDHPPGFYQLPFVATLDHHKYRP
jgi:hypothetical protein